MLWCTFAITWDLALLGWISVTMEEVLYVGCDFSAKVCVGWSKRKWNRLRLAMYAYDCLCADTPSRVPQRCSQSTYHRGNNPRPDILLFLQVLFSSTLMLSSFKEIEARRENAMRVIEGSSKAKLIAELQVRSRVCVCVWRVEAWFVGRAQWGEAWEAGAMRSLPPTESWYRCLTCLTSHQPESPETTT